jgi:hypothetical protein
VIYCCGTSDKVGNLHEWCLLISQFYFSARDSHGLHLLYFWGACSATDRIAFAIKVRNIIDVSLWHVVYEFIERGASLNYSY